jgi:hypothetical protein
VDLELPSIKPSQPAEPPLSDEDVLAALRRPLPQSKSNVTLPGAAVADRDDVLSTSNVFAAGKLQDQCLVERRDRREVETAEAFHCREPRLLDAALDHPSFPLDQFKFSQAQQIAGMVDALGGALLGELVVFAQEGRQSERLEVMDEQKLGCVAHDAAPARRPR